METHLVSLFWMSPLDCTIFRHKDWDLLTPFELNELSYYKNIRVPPELLQWLINHFDPSDNLFRHNNFEICPLFEEFSIISRRIPMVEEVLTMPRLDIDPALLNHALSMDLTSPYWPSLIHFCMPSQYLLLSGIDCYGSLRLMPIVEQMVRHRTAFPLIMAETFTWLGEHAWDPNSVLGLMGSLLLL
ncbi:hypothetical protein JCGZ_24184 [Jatropha curcas]|uniref:Uncharacterized protein n=1 Tax=Jatropha curcas TaxID=180498 RepID=A0A067JMF9_JATCU|nr:hypothetical protein JCGZ_24184 [Jatropha curcas]